MRAVLYHALKWAAWNLWIEMFVRRRATTYRRPVYEEFAGAPHSELATIVAAHRLAAIACRCPGRMLGLHLGSNHTVDGNGYRFRVGRPPSGRTTNREKG